jgi:hypothetical protein
LSFDPTQAEFYEKAVDELQLNESEEDVFRRFGFVSVDHKQRYSFPSMYYAIYTHDLPVLVTTDSVLHAIHRSYEDVLTDIEVYSFLPTMDKLLTACHELLADLYTAETASVFLENYQDVDLYLAVARNLLAQEEPPKRGLPATKPSVDDLPVRSHFGQDDKVREMVRLIGSFQLQYPYDSRPTKIYGGQRYVDYSQFRPRGHYASDFRLRPYFKCMMWLGRPDCGWHVTIPSSEVGSRVDSDRELRDTALLVRLLEETGGIESLKKIGNVLDIMVGPDDDLTPLELASVLAKQGIVSLEQLAGANELAAVREAIEVDGLASQRIRSQVVMSNRNDRTRRSPPRMFQLFGQRFMLDAMILSNVVFDSIVVNGRKIERMMPTGLDVMAALGNDTSIFLLEEELRRYQYSGNVAALRDYLAQRPPAFWRAGLSNIWLDCLRTLDDDMATHRDAPEVMRTRMWQRKQLQTQLASWAEIRHDMLLYGKQSYTGGPSCEYPAGYVEPYPDLYASLEHFCSEAARALSDVEFPRDEKRRRGTPTRERIVSFFQRSAEVFDRLESLARKELALQPFDGHDQKWLKKVISAFSISGPPTYSGWYCDLYYKHGWDLEKWCPTVADVHTDPESASVLQAGVGDARFCVVAIDSEEDRAVFVGPIYSYYEFTSDADKRLTDHGWQDMIKADKLPESPAWFDAFQGLPEKRTLSKRRINW